MENPRNGHVVIIGNMAILEKPKTVDIWQVNTYSIKPTTSL